MTKSLDDFLEASGPERADSDEDALAQIWSEAWDDESGAASTLGALAFELKQSDGALERWATYQCIGDAIRASAGGRFSHESLSLPSDQLSWAQAVVKLASQSVPEAALVEEFDLSASGLDDSAVEPNAGIDLHKDSGPKPHDQASSPHQSGWQDEMGIGSQVRPWVPAAAPVNGRGRAANEDGFRQRAWLGLAAAAVVVMGLGWSLWGGGQQPSNSLPAAVLVSAPQTPTSTSQGTVSSDSTQWVTVETQQGTLVRDPQLEALIQAHRSAGGVAGLHAPSGFVRAATQEVGTR